MNYYFPKKKYSPLAVIFLLMIFGVCTSSCGKLMNKAPEQPNIILISIDTLRADHLGAYGYFRDTSPNIDRFAKNSLLFKYAYSSSSFTAPSLSSMLSGFLPHETQVLSNNVMLPAGVETIAEALRKKGYRTAAVVSSYVVREESHFDQGFEDYNDTLDGREVTRHLPERIAESTTRAALNWLQENKQEPFFLWIHYVDPHGPYFPNTVEDRMAFLNDGKTPSKLLLPSDIPHYQRFQDKNDQAFYVAQYDGEIRYLDRELGKIFDHIENSSLKDSALTLFTSDHGEGLGEQNKYYFYHGEHVYHFLIQIPLIVHWQGRKGVSDTPTQLLDIVPTIAEVTSLEKNSGWRGQSLLKRNLALVPIFVEAEQYDSVILGEHQLIFDENLKTYQLFDVRKDPKAEGENLFQEPGLASKVDQMKKYLHLMREENFLKVEESKKELDPETIQKLKSLGYT